MEEASSIVKALENAWKRAGSPREFSVKVLEKPEKNFFGLTTKKAKIAFLFTEEVRREERRPQPRRDDRRGRDDRRQQRGYQDSRRRDSSYARTTTDRQPRQQPQRKSSYTRTTTDRKASTDQPSPRSRQTSGSTDRQRQSSFTQAPADRQTQRPETRRQEPSTTERQPRQADRQTQRPETKRQEPRREASRPERTTRDQSSHKDSAGTAELRRIDKQDTQRKQARPQPSFAKTPADQSSQGLRPAGRQDRRPEPSQGSDATWTNEMIEAVQQWTKETLTMIKQPDVTFSVNKGTYVIRLNFHSKIASDSRQEEMLFKSWSGLAMQSIRDQFKKPLRNLRVFFGSSQK